MQNEKYEAPLNIYISSSYDDAELAQKFLSDYVKGFGITVDKQRNGDELYVTIDGLDEDIDALVSVYTAQYDEFKKDCKAEPSGWVSPVNFEKSKEDESMKSESNIEDLRDQTISWGTMRSEDLIPKFLGVLKTYAKDKYDEYVNENPEVLDIDGLDDETLGWIVDELFDKLDEIAPEGTYFGAHPDDGADYGFWSVDESKQREAKKSDKDGKDDKDCKGKGCDGSNEECGGYKKNEANKGMPDLGEYAFKAVGWEWDDNAECYYDRDGAMVDDVDSETIRIDPIEYDGHTYSEIEVMGGGNIQIKDTSGDGQDWTACDTELVRKVYDSLKKLASKKGKQSGKSKGKNPVRAMYEWAEKLGVCPSFSLSDEFGSFDDEDYYAVDGFCFGDDDNDIDGPMVYGSNDISYYNDGSWGYALADGTIYGDHKDSTFIKSLLNIYKDKGLKATIEFAVESGDEIATKMPDFDKHESKQVEDAGNDWVAYYFCKDPQGLEWAVLPHTVSTVGNVNCVNARGGMESIGKEYVLSKCTPVEDVESSEIWKAVCDGEDRKVVAIDRNDAERVLRSENGLEELKSVVAGKSESKKNEKGTTKIETYEGFDELLGYADAEYLLEDVVDVLSKYYTYEDETFDEDQAKDDPEFTIKIEGGDERADYYCENIFYVHLPSKDAAEELASVLGGKLEESKKNEADATFKVGDFVSYEAGKDGKDPYDAYVYCEVISINDDGTLDLCTFGTDANTDGIGDNANPAYCEKLDHFAGMVDAHHYYMDGKYNAYKGGWEILITNKELNPKVYEFIGTIDDLSEVIDIDDYYGGENFVFDEDLKDEVANNTGWDVDTTTFADMTGDVGESKQTEASPNVATIEGLKSLLGRGIAVADNELRCKDVWKLNSKNPKQRQWTFVGDNGSISIKTDDDFKVIRIWGDLNKKSFDLGASENKEGSKKSEDFDMNKAFFQVKKAITDWTKRQGHKTLEWLYTDGRKSPTSYPSGIWDFEWDTGNGMATAELKVSPYETRTNSWNDSMDFSLKVGTEDKPTFYTSVEDVLYALDTLISKTEIKMESKKSESLTLKQAELKKMAKYGEAEDITGLSDAEAKELKKSGVELVGISRGTYGMNGALMRGTSDGKLYVITSRNSNLFYFV